MKMGMKHNREKGVKCYPTFDKVDLFSLCSIKSKFRGILKPFAFCREKPGNSKVSADWGRVFY